MADVNFNSSSGIFDLLDSLNYPMDELNWLERTAKQSRTL